MICGNYVSSCEVVGLKLCRSALCAILMKQNAVGIQVFSATVGRLGQTGTVGSKSGHNQVKLGQMWIKHGSRGLPGSC